MIYPRNNDEKTGGKIVVHKIFQRISFESHFKSRQRIVSNVLPQEDAVFFFERNDLNAVIKNRVPQGVVVLKQVCDELHLVPVVGVTPHLELADLIVQRILLKPHRTPKCDVRLLRIKDPGFIDHPQSYKTNTFYIL